MSEILEEKTEGKSITKRIITKKDYQMGDGEYTDRYKKFIKIRIIDPVRGLYQINEEDKKKGWRFTIIDSKGNIEDEVKWK